MAVGAGEAAWGRAKAAVQGLTGYGLERQGRTPARPASLHTQITWDILPNQLGNN